ncbi:MAG: bifunctional phosphopantothenoylcysteine decarboxylase/phosphopantothenate--cysteine ligase CoaBC [Bacteroidetes bacterium]|nr:bifunctional phosphopantothenoylcysteine decarboxylase/phosphopantothenate--cysteine ligase CoaBC [Bacteroidota bacterium]MCB9043655.1 bifunctional phosphopantothenoylcysteine decarboxylase/phosphopantothenate--cysteine ligase CoaBC [Chitinophagales bacterium]
MSSQKFPKYEVAALSGKKILVGVCGSIAAYKTALLVRLLVKTGAQVQVIMTPSATSFITPLTLATLSQNPALSHFEKNEDGLWNNHVHLGLEHDLFVIAPATANTLAKMAYGMCDNLLMATYLSAKCPVMIAPAMDLDMWKHPATQNNLQILQNHKVQLIPVTTGELASGLYGEGRMAEPEDIVTHIQQHFAQPQPLKGKKVLITAGPTYENIDPVRFIGNHSSGKMGIALAEVAHEAGAEVHLVLGPTDFRPEFPQIHVYSVRPAAQMLAACLEYFSQSDLIIMAAAVSDYTPVTVADQKIKKKEETFEIKLRKTPDIAQTLGTQKKANQLLIGFALETQNEVENAQLKIKKKNLDAIVLNSLQDKGAGFRHDTNKVSIINAQNEITDFPLKSKKEVAKDIIHYCLHNFPTHFTPSLK